MKILIFSLAYDPFVGGAEVAVKEITRRIPGIEFDMVTLNLNGKEKSFEKIENVNIYRIHSSKNLFALRAFFLGVKLHVEKHYDIVWSIMANYAGFAGLFLKWRFKNLKFVLTLQEGATHAEIKQRVRFFSWLHRQIFKQADLIQVISKYLYDFAKEMNQKVQIVVIPNGVSSAIFSDISHDDVDNIKQKLTKKPGEIFLVTTSRLSRKNGLAHVIQALTSLPTNIFFIILGVGELDEYLKNLAVQLGVEARVKFLGLVSYDKIPPYLGASDIFIRASLSEGFGNSFIEAMAAGIPVIATPVGGIVDFLKDEETGFFCEPQNPASIAAAIKKVLENPERTQRVVGNAKELAIKKYDWDLIATRMKNEVFEKIK